MISECGHRPSRPRCIGLGQAGLGHHKQQAPCGGNAQSRHDLERADTAVCTRLNNLSASPLVGLRASPLSVIGKCALS
jgi:hypothetical protein